MRRNGIVLWVVLALSFLAGAQQADAHAWCNTRRHCGLFKKYTANAHTGCHPIPFPFCAHHGNGCGSASASCSTSCLPGSASSSANNSSLGCDLTIHHTWFGWASATPGTAEPRDDEQGGGRVSVVSDFDDRRKTVTVSLEEGTIYALLGGQATRVEVYVFREDAVEGSAGSEEPVRTRENTLWQGYVELRDGRISAEGFDTRSVAVSVNPSGVAYAVLSKLQASIPLAISDADFDRLVVQAVETEAGGPTSK